MKPWPSPSYLLSLSLFSTVYSRLGNKWGIAPIDEEVPCVEQLSTVVGKIKSLSTGIKLSVEEMPYGCKGRGTRACSLKPPVCPTGKRTFRGLQKA